MRSRPTHHPRAAMSRAVRLIPVLALLALTGCGKTPTKPAVAGTTFTGTATAQFFSGKLTVVIASSTVAAPNGGFAAQAVITATGTFTPLVGPAMALAGDYDNSFKTYAVYGRDGGGLVWAFYGQTTTFGFRGIVDADTSDGISEGYSAVLRGGTGVTAVLGTSNSTPPGGVMNFSFAFSGTELHGDAVAVDTSWAATPLDGTIDAGGNIVIVQAADSGFPPLHIPTPATGTYDSGTGAASGTYNDGAGSTGTWSGTKRP